MSTLVTIFKIDLSGKHTVVDALKTWSAEIKELESAFVFSVKPGMLISFLQLLNHHSISYGTHFSDDQSHQLTLPNDRQP